MGSSHRRPEHCTWHIHSKREGVVGTLCSGINESSRAETATMPLSYDGLKDGMEGGLRPGRMGQERREDGGGPRRTGEEKCQRHLAKGKAGVSLT